MAHQTRETSSTKEQQPKEEAALARRKQHRAEARLGQTEQWLRMLIDSAEDYAIFSIDNEGKISSWNRGAEKIFGYPGDEIIGRQFATIFTREDREQGVPEEEIAHAKRDGYSPDHRWHLRKDDSQIFVSGCVRPLRDTSGHVQGFLKVAHDITEQRRIELELRESEARYRLLVENVKDFAIFTFDLAGNITHWNPGAERVFGYLEEEILGQSVDALYTVEARKAGRPQKDRDQVLRDGWMADDTWFVRKDGRRIFVTEALRRMDDGTMMKGFAKVAHDITERKKMEDELRQARDHLETLVGERTARLQQTIGELESFSYSLSHDLRAPLRAMQGFSEILREEYSERLGNHGADLINKIINAANRLDELIQDVLTLNQVAQEPIHLAPVDLEAVLRGIISELPALQEPNATVSLVESPRKVFGHRASLNQCFSNLLLNAVKFVKSGVHPEVKIRCEPTDGRVRIWVEDNGIGIPKEQHERIFGLFQRLHRGEIYHGTGIGLAIVRKAVERMNGKVGVESEPEKGSRFWVELGKAD